VVCARSLSVGSGEMRCFAPATMTHAPHDVAQASPVISATNTTRPRSSLLFVCTYSQFLWSGGKTDQAGQNLLGRRLTLIDCQFLLRHRSCGLPHPCKSMTQCPEEGAVEVARTFGFCHLLLGQGKLEGPGVIGTFLRFACDAM